jgi:hypothetical protein
MAKRKKQLNETAPGTPKSHGLDKIPDRYPKGKEPQWVIDARAEAKAKKDKDKDNKDKDNKDKDTDTEKVDEAGTSSWTPASETPRQKRARQKLEKKEKDDKAKKKDKDPKESVNTARFLGALTQKNYAEANKYLRAVVNSKLVKVIKQSQQEN